MGKRLKKLYKKVCVTHTDLSIFVVGRATVKDQGRPVAVYMIGVMGIAVRHNSGKTTVVNRKNRGW